MRALTFAKRNFREIVRDPLNLCFLFGFPVVLLLLLVCIFRLPSLDLAFLCSQYNKELTRERDALKLELYKNK